jgi:F0F1-type ATP synthase membrane subunit b/b'
MDLIERIDELQVVIEEAKAVPLSSSAVVNREELLELLAQLKEEVPDEVRQARWMSKDRDELIERARKEGERIIAEAQESRDRLLSRTEIVHAAQREGERIIDEAKERAAKIRVEAEDYVDQKLAAFEILLNKTLQTVSRGREQLRGTNKVSVSDPHGIPAVDADHPGTGQSGPQPVFDAENYDQELTEPAR